MKHAGMPPSTGLNSTVSKTMVDAFLNPLFSQLTEDARRISPHYETLWQDIHTLYKAGGKRLRSYITMLTYEAFSNQPIENVLPAAAAQEILHIAMLIHDDVIDRDDIRYGIKNISRKYLDHYQELIKDESERQHFANSAAILAGDLLISEAHALMTEAKIDPMAILASQRLLTKATFHTAGGELLDTEASFRGEDAADPLEIAKQKTARYSFVNPFLIGATLAKVPQAQQDILQELGEELGVAYQLRNDLLGIFGDETKTGKSTAGDIKEGKHTLLTKEFYIRASLADQHEFETLFAKGTVTNESIQRVRSLLVTSGAQEAVENLISAYHTHAVQLLDGLSLDDVHYKVFSQLIELCLQREK